MQSNTMSEAYNGCTCGQYKFDPSSDLSACHPPGKNKYKHAVKLMKVPKLVTLREEGDLPEGSGQMDESKLSSILLPFQRIQEEYQEDTTGLP